jgi:hypothetical protein
VPSVGFGRKAMSDTRLLWQTCPRQCTHTRVAACHRLVRASQHSDRPYDRPLRLPPFLPKGSDRRRDLMTEMRHGAAQGRRQGLVLLSPDRLSETRFLSHQHCLAIPAQDTPACLQRCLSARFSQKLGDLDDDLIRERRRSLPRKDHLILRLGNYPQDQGTRPMWPDRREGLVGTPGVWAPRALFPRIRLAALAH